MTISNADVLKGYYNQKQALGAPSISSDATLEIEGYEHLTFNIKQFPWPILTTMGEIEQAGPMGTVSFTPQQLRTAQQGPMTINETVNGTVADWLEVLAVTGGVFNARAYEGTPNRHTRGYKIKDAFWVVDQPDRDFENRSQVTQISGTLFYHYFGEKIPGNSPVL